MFLLLTQAFASTPIVGQPRFFTLQKDLTCGKDAELKEWMDKDGNNIQVYGIIKLNEEIIYPDVFEINQYDTIHVAKSPDEAGALMVYDTSEASNRGSLTSYATNYLPYRNNSATFLQLSHSDRGNWFITYKLSGCDIWIAKPKGLLEPLVIHANANQHS